MRDMILNGGPGDIVTVHTDKKIKRKKRGRTDGGCAGVSIITEHEDKIYRTSFLNKRWLTDNTSVSFGYI
jgi:hypothetical protein